MKIPVKEYKKNEEILAEESSRHIEAEFELSLLIKSLCVEYAQTIRDLAFYLKYELKERISEELLYLLMNLSIGRIKKIIDKIIVKTHGSSGYSSYELHEHWKVIRKPFLGIFHRKHFYYENPDFVNPYILKDEDLPLHINRNWADDKLKKVYMKRMK